MMKIGVIDYEAGNLKSVETALKYCSIDYFVSDKPKDFKKADKIIFPGVGEARAAMDVITKKGLDEEIIMQVEKGKHFLGICIGYQILFEKSEERDTECLRLIPGTVKRFPEKKGCKIPHMGWNEVLVGKETESPLFVKIPEKSSYYFVHSYYPSPRDDENVLGSTEYIISFAACYRKNNLVAVQFHPEKSGEAGLQFLKNFVAMKD